jgi:hypothetical protein
MVVKVRGLDTSNEAENPDGGRIESPLCQPKTLYVCGS